MSKYTCFICGYRTLDERCGWEICPICFWEDDVLVQGDEDRSSGANHMTVVEAQANYSRISAISPEYLDKVRPPRENEQRDPDWKPLGGVAREIDNDGSL